VKRQWLKRIGAAAGACFIAVLAIVLVPLGRPSTEDAAPASSPVPILQVSIPPGGVALFYGPQYCCNLVTIAPDGTVTYQLGDLERSRAASWTWAAQRGLLPTTVHLTPDEAAQFMGVAQSIPPNSGLRPIIAGVRPTFDRGTLWGIVRSGGVDTGYYRGEADPFFAALGAPAPTTEMVMPTPPPTHVPSDAVGFVYEQAFFIVHRSGEVTMQRGGGFGADARDGGWYPSWDASLTYEVYPISKLLAWKIVSFAPLVYVPPGCPGLDDARTYRYLVIVTSRGISNGLFCHAWSPLRDDLMSIVQIVYQER